MSGKLTAEQVREIINRHWGNLSWQAIADELNAALGSGTCEMVKLERFDGMDPSYRCSGCGHENYEFERPRYCPNCRAEVVA